ncbi:ABC transporter permease [Nocardia callitridis]|uniref:ABC transporter permease n=1 Tax=Nocardia callitridis TaxID=648753 RepID=A0ABP9L283_9NOCA
MNHLDLVLSPDIVAATVRSLIPLLLLGIGGLLCHQAGVFNVALEGLLLTGCFAAVTGSALSGSATVGVLVAVAASGGVAYLLAVGSVSRHGDPLILGTAINLLVSGTTAFGLVATFHVRGTFTRPDLARLPHWTAPHDIPLIGPTLTVSSPLGLLTLVAIPAVYVFLRHTVIGTRLRGVGAHADAAQSLGIRPDRYQIAALLASGLLCGLAGAELSLGSVALFTEDMSAGRGWIIVLILLLTGGRPVAVLAALTVYAYSQALGFRLQTVGLPMQFSDAAPYLTTLGVLIVVGVRAKRARLRHSPELDP